MRVFLTGASGYVGTVLSDRLTRSGHEVRALVRPTSDRSRLDKIGVSCFLGDVTDRYSMREAMSGADWVIHAAADLEFGGPPERMRRVNVEGSENVASLAYKLGVGRLLSVSSIAVFGGSAPDGTASNESSPPVEPMPTLYSSTKRAGEFAIQAWAEKGLAVNTVYPSLVYGPPGKRSGANAILRSIVKGRLPAVVGADRRSSWIHIEDLTRGIEKILQVAEPGESYLLAGDVTTIGDLVREVSRLAAVKPPRLELSVAQARFLGVVTKPYFRLRGHRSPFVAEQLASLERHWYFDDGKAQSELDWKPRSLSKGLPETVEFLKG